MERTIETELKKWQKETHPHPILLRGARQVGKTYVIENFAKKNFKNYIYINFELDRKYKPFFDELYPEEIIKKISGIKNETIVPGETLLIFDEIQECPNAIQSLRYFYEMVPGLHVIGAGSLLEFTLRSKDFKMPVGRIKYLFLQPLSFLEFLEACGRGGLINFIKELNLKKEIDDTIHNELIQEIKNYFIVGGMPKAVQAYIDSNNYLNAFDEQKIIIQTYRDDFGKYASKKKYKYLDAVFDSVPRQIQEKFVYSNVDPDLKVREVKEALNLLTKAGIVTKVISTSGEPPLKAPAKEKNFKVIFLDLGLVRNIFDFDLEPIFKGDMNSSAMGKITEQFAGQEILASLPFNEIKKIFYWRKEKPQSSAELDYLTQIKGKIIPIEVKSGSTGRLKSMHNFMSKHKSKIGIKISMKKMRFENNILDLPFYAISELERLVNEIV